MRNEQVICDGCGADLTTRTNSVDYRLVLTSESKPGHGEGFYTAMMIYPPIDRTHHFCRLDCLDQWRAREQHGAGLWRNWWTNWKLEHGTTWEGGSSYPEPPKEMRDALDLEFKAAALAAFPMERAKKAA